MGTKLDKKQIWIISVKCVENGLPEWRKNHQLDTEEFAHRFDRTQLFSQSLVEQHKTVHGKLKREEVHH